VLSFNIAESILSKIGYNNLIYLIKRPQIHPVIHYPLLLTARNYLRLSNHCPYTDYWHVSTIDPVADSNISARNVKSATIDRIEYAN